MELFNATLNRFHRGRRVETGIHSGVLLSIFKTDFWDCGIPDFRSVMANGLEEWIRLNDAQVMKSVPKPTSETSSTQLFTRKLGEHPYSLIKRRALVGLSLSLYSIDFPIQVFKSRQLNWILNRKKNAFRKSFKLFCIWTVKYMHIRASLLLYAYCTWK